MVVVVCPRARCSGALLFSTHRDAPQRLPPMGRPRPGNFSALGTGEAGDNRLPRCLVCTTRKCREKSLFWTFSSVCNRGPSGGVGSRGSRLGTEGLLGTTAFVVM